MEGKDTDPKRAFLTVIIAFVLLSGMFLGLLSFSAPPVGNAEAASPYGDITVDGIWRWINGTDRPVDGNITVINGGVLVIQNSTLTFLQDRLHPWNFDVDGGSLIVRNSVITSTAKQFMPRLKVEMSITDCPDLCIFEDSTLAFPGWFNVTGTEMYINGTTFKKVDVDYWNGEEAIGKEFPEDENDDCPVIFVDASVVQFSDSRIEDYLSLDNEVTYSPYGLGAYHDAGTAIGDGFYWNDTLPNDLTEKDNPAGNTMYFDRMEWISTGESLHLVGFDYYSEDLVNLSTTRFSYVGLLFNYRSGYNYTAGDAVGINLGGSFVPTDLVIEDTNNSFVNQEIDLTRYGIDTLAEIETLEIILNNTDLNPIFVDQVQVLIGQENDIVVNNSELYAFNSYFDIDFLKQTPKPLNHSRNLIDKNQEHRTLRALNDAVITLVNVTVNTGGENESGGIDITGNSCFTYDDTSTIYLYRWLEITTTDVNGTPTPNATVWVNSTIDNQAARDAVNAQNNLQDYTGSDIYILNYMNSTRRYPDFVIKEDTYFWTAADGKVKIPVVSDIIDSDGWPNSNFVGNYWVNTTLRNATIAGNEYFGNGTSQLGLSYFPWMMTWNNTKQHTVAMADVSVPPPDLEPTSIWIDTDPIYQNNNVTIYVDVTNDEQTPSSNVYVLIYDNPAGYDRTLLKATNVSVDGNSVENITVPWGNLTGTQIVGPHNIEVIVDPLNTIVESDETNNALVETFTVQKNVPELWLDGVDISFTPDPVAVNNMVNITVTVHNSGRDNATPVIVRLFNDSHDNDPNSPNKIGNDITLPWVSNGTVASGWTMWQAPNNPGSYTIWAWADPADVINEEDDSVANNTAFDILTVIPKPDLTLEAVDIQVADSIPDVGVATQVSVAIHNDGGVGVSGPFSVRVFDDYNPRNGVMDAGELIDQSNYSGVIAAGGIGWHNITWTPTVSGIHTIYVMLDHVGANGIIDESNELNNDAFREFLAMDEGRDIIVNDTRPVAPYTPGTLTISNVALKQHHGFVLVEDTGVLTLRDSHLRVLQDYDDQYRILVRDDGVLRIEDGSRITSNMKLGIYLQDNATLIMNASSLGTNVNIICNGSSDSVMTDTGPTARLWESTIEGDFQGWEDVDIFLTATNTTFYNPLDEFQGSSNATLLNVVNEDGAPLDVIVSQNATAWIYWWVDVITLDANLVPIENVQVTLSRNNLPPPGVFDADASNASGVTWFAPLEKRIYPTWTHYTEMYIFNATYVNGASTFWAPEMEIPIQFNKRVYMNFSAVMPDLTVTNISLDNYVPSAGNRVWINATVNNTGDSNAVGAWVSWYLDEVSVDGFMHTEQLDLAFGTGQVVSYDWTAIGGAHTLYVVIDPADEIEEGANEGNNQLTRAVQVTSELADLIVDSVFVTPIGGGAPILSAFNNTDVEIHTMLNNSGSDAMTDSFWVLFTVNGWFLAEVEYDVDLLIGTPVEVALTWSLNFTGSNIPIVVTINPVTGPAIVTEDDMGNNDGNALFDIDPRPNLMVDYIRLDPKTAIVGAPVTLIVSISNDGDLASGAFELRFYVNGQTFTTENVANVPSLGVIEVSSTTNWVPSAIRYQTLSATADWNDAVLETNNSDNTGTLDVTVFNPLMADGTGTDIIVSDTQPATSPGNLFLPYTNPQYELSGFVLVEEGGTLTLDNCLFYVNQPTGKDFEIIVRDNGTLILRNGAELMSNRALKLRLYDSATLLVEGSTIRSTVTIDAGWSLNQFSTNEVHVNFTKSSFMGELDCSHPAAKVNLTGIDSQFTQSFDKFGGQSYAQLVNVTVNGGIDLPDNSSSVLHRFWWLSVTTVDGNDQPLDTAVVTAYVTAMNHLYVEDANPQTSIDGKVVFKAIAHRYYATDDFPAGNFHVNGVFTDIFAVPHASTDSYIQVKDGNVATKIRFTDVYPNLDPIVTFYDENWIVIPYPASYAVKTNVIHINATVTNNGISPAWNVTVTFEDKGEFNPVSFPLTVIGTDFREVLNVSETRDFSLTWTVDLPVGTDAQPAVHNVTATVDADGAELDPDDNWGYGLLNAVSYADLFIDSADIIAKATPTHGEDVRIDVTVHNLGDVDATAVDVILEYAPSSGGPFTNVSYAVISDVIGKAGDLYDARTARLYWTIPYGITAGDYTYRVTVDGNDEIQELNNSNNWAEITVTVLNRADLNVFDVWFTDATKASNNVSQVENNTKVEIHAQVQNLGQTAATFVLVEFYDGPVSDNKLINSTHIETVISQGDIDSTHIEWTPTIGHGERSLDKQVFVVVNSDGLIDEANMADNTGSATLPINDPRPDLIIPEGNVTFLDEEITDGQMTPMNITIYNFGMTNATDFAMIIFDGTPSVDNLTADLLVEDVPPMGNYTVSTNISLPGIGWHNVTIRLDPRNATFPNGAVDEYNNSNNDIVVPVEVLPGLISIVINEPAVNSEHPETTILTVNVTISTNITENMTVTVQLLDMDGLPISEAQTFTFSGEGSFSRDVWLPEFEGETTSYSILVTVTSEDSGQVYEEEISIYVSGIIVEPPESGIPAWLWLIIIAMIAGSLVVVVLYLYKYGLGRLVECGECGALIPVGSAKCPKCGVEFEKDTAKCSVCESWIPMSSETCPECGAEFKAVEPEAIGYKQQMQAKYDEMVSGYKAQAMEELGDDLSDEKFQEWWQNHPDFIAFEAWMALEETRRGMDQPIECPDCGQLNEPGATICGQCGKVFEVEKPVELEPKQPKKVAPVPARPAPAPAPDTKPAEAVTPQPVAPQKVAPKAVTPKKVAQPVAKPTVVPKKVAAAKPTVVPKKVAAGKPTVVPKKVVKPGEAVKPTVVPKKVVKKSGEGEK